MMKPKYKKRTCRAAILAIVMLIGTFTGCAGGAHYMHWHAPLSALRAGRDLPYYHCPHCGRIVPKHHQHVCSHVHEPLPYYGFHATCWRAWPQDWLNCPPPEMVAPLHPSDELLGILPPFDEPVPQKGDPPSLSDQLPEPPAQLEAAPPVDPAPPAAPPMQRGSRREVPPREEQPQPPVQARPESRPEPQSKLTTELQGELAAQPQLQPSLDIHRDIPVNQPLGPAPIAQSEPTLIRETPPALPPAVQPSNESVCQESAEVKLHPEIPPAIERQAATPSFVEGSGPATAPFHAPALQEPTAAARPMPEAISRLHTATPSEPKIQAPALQAELQATVKPQIRETAPTVPLGTRPPVAPQLAGEAVPSAALKRFQPSKAPHTDGPPTRKAETRSARNSAPALQWQSAPTLAKSITEAPALAATLPTPSQGAHHPTVAARAAPEAISGLQTATPLQPNVQAPAPKPDLQPTTKPESRETEPIEPLGREPSVALQLAGKPAQSVELKPSRSSEAPNTNNPQTLKPEMRSAQRSTPVLQWQTTPPLVKSLTKTPPLPATLPTPSRGAETGGETLTKVNPVAERNGGGAPANSTTSAVPTRITGSHVTSKPVVIVPVAAPQLNPHTAPLTSARTGTDLPANDSETGLYRSVNKKQQTQSPRGTYRLKTAQDDAESRAQTTTTMDAAKPVPKAEATPKTATPKVPLRFVEPVATKANDKPAPEQFSTIRSGGFAGGLRWIFEPAPICWLPQITKSTATEPSAKESAKTSNPAKFSEPNGVQLHLVEVMPAAPELITKSSIVDQQEDDQKEDTPQTPRLAKSSVANEKVAQTATPRLPRMAVREISRNTSRRESTSTSTER